MPNIGGRAETSASGDFDKWAFQAPRREGGSGPERMFPKLKPGPGMSSEDVAADQRARLHAAMIEACARHGYAATTVREVATLAGVSTAAMYRNFAGKQECFLSTYDTVVEQAISRISSAYRTAPREEGDWPVALCRAFEAFSREMVERPAPSRLALIEILAAGPEAIERIERAEATFGWMIRQSFRQAPDGYGVSPTLIRPLIGGIWFVSRHRLADGCPEALTGCSGELFKWMTAYRSSTTVPLFAVPTPRAEIHLGIDGVLEKEADERRRILRAAAAVLARSGFQGLAQGSITEVARVPPKSFANHFANVDECFLSTLELLSAEALARALRESDGAPSWAAGVFRAVRALFCQIAEDRAFARSAFLGPFSVGPAETQRRASLAQRFAEVFIGRAPLGRQPSPLVAEAIVGSMWSLIQRQVVGGRARQLPALTARGAFLALAPIVGAENAMATIQQEQRSPASDGSASSTG